MGAILFSIQPVVRSVVQPVLARNERFGIGEVQEFTDGTALWRKTIVDDNLVTQYWNGSIWITQWEVVKPI